MSGTPTRNRHRRVTTDRVAEAADRVHAGTYHHGTDQLSPHPMLLDMLYLLDVIPGMRILELGTGSGYSGQLLAHLTGPHGHVVSIDADDTLVRQAQQLHQRTNTPVTVLSANELESFPRGPFDRVIAWTAPAHIPYTWMEQITPGGTIVSPVTLAPPRPRPRHPPHHRHQRPHPQPGRLPVPRGVRNCWPFREYPLSNLCSNE